MLDRYHFLPLSVVPTAIVEHEKFSMHFQFGNRGGRDRLASVVYIFFNHSQGGFLNLGGSIGFIFLDTAWTGVSWDGGMSQSQEGAGGSSEEASETTPLLSFRAWEILEKQLGRDSGLRLLIIVMRVSVSRTTRLDPRLAFVFSTEVWRHKPSYSADVCRCGRGCAWVRIEEKTPRG